MTALSLGREAGNGPLHNKSQRFLGFQLISPVCLSPESDFRGRDVHADETSAVLSLPPLYAGSEVVELRLKLFFTCGREESFATQRALPGASFCNSVSC